MRAPFTTLQVMRHPDVVLTINTLVAIEEWLRAERDALTAERDALKWDVQVLREALQEADKLCPVGSETEIWVRAALEASK